MQTVSTMLRSKRLILLACACGPSAAQMPIVPSRAAERPDPTKEMSACATMGPWIGCVFALYEDIKAELEAQREAQKRESLELRAQLSAQKEAHTQLQAETRLALQAVRELRAQVEQQKEELAGLRASAPASLEARGRTESVLVEATRHSRVVES